MKKIKFILFKDLSKQLSSIPLGGGLTLLDAFIIKGDGMSSYLYEMNTQSPIIQTHKRLKDLLLKLEIERVIWNITSDVEKSHKIIINQPELMVEHKNQKL
jgi:hypothetical protein